MDCENDQIINCHNSCERECSQVVHKYLCFSEPSLVHTAPSTSSQKRRVRNACSVRLRARTHYTKTAQEYPMVFVGERLYDGTKSYVDSGDYQSMNYNDT
jgi:hypothetical protein